MASRENDQTPPQPQPLLSSLIVRPSNIDAAPQPDSDHRHPGSGVWEVTVKDIEPVQILTHLFVIEMQLNMLVLIISTPQEYMDLAIGEIEGDIETLHPIMINEEGKNMLDRSPPPVNLGHRHHGRDVFSNERKGFERRSKSPPAPPLPHWARDVRERSRSPVRGAPPPKDYRHDDMHMDGVRDGRRHGAGRDKIR